jgi:hypothetical protein
MYSSSSGKKQKISRLMRRRNGTKGTKGGTKGGMEWSNLLNWIQRRTKKRNSTRMSCSPMVAGQTATPTTCYTKDILLKIRDAYNRTHPSDKHISEHRVDAVLDALQQRLKTTCVKEDCWLELLPYQQRKYISEHIFAPNQPKEWLNNPSEWLSNFDILGVLRQYEMAFPTFEFLGPSPMDFDKKLSKAGCVWDEICHFQLSKYMKKGTKKIGMSFNLDDHDEAGSHWVSLYIDIPNKLIFYLDSALNSTPPEIEVLVERIREQAEKLGWGKMDYQKNTVQHQFSNTECGMYSLFFFVTLITEKWGGVGASMTIPTCLRRFLSQRIPDKMVAQFRNRYFNLPPDK